MATYPFRVLIVDDYEPWRRFTCTTLQKQSKLQVIGEVSDGLEAVQQAEQLQPDLILLDIGLPTLNGIEAARRIRKLSPISKIVFVTQESSADVVQEALNMGASGYVVKAHAGRDLIAAVDAVREGRLFVSAGVAGRRPAEVPLGSVQGGMDSHIFQRICEEHSAVYSRLRRVIVLLSLHRAFPNRCSLPCCQFRVLF